MPLVEKPAEGSWTQHYPELGTGPVSYEDSISPEYYELLRHLHKTAGAYVAAYQAQREPPHAAGHTSVAPAAR